jgi:hypothetical protein
LILPAGSTEPDQLPSELGEWRVVLFTLAVSLGTRIVFGLLPASHRSRADLNTTLKASGGPSGTVFKHDKARSLLVGSALLIRTSMALRGVDPASIHTTCLPCGSRSPGPVL